MLCISKNIIIIPVQKIITQKSELDSKMVNTVKMVLNKSKNSFFQKRFQHKFQLPTSRSKNAGKIEKFAPKMSDVDTRGRHTTRQVEERSCIAIGKFSLQLNIQQCDLICLCYKAITAVNIQPV